MSKKIIQEKLNIIPNQREKNYKLAEFGNAAKSLEKSTENNSHK